MPASRTAPERSSGRAPARSAAREALRALPQVNAIMEREEARQEAVRHGRRIVTALVRERLDFLRKRIRSGALDASAARSEVDGLLAWVGGEIRARTDSTIRPVINATGVVLHTNLGRAVLPEAATRRMAEVSRAYTTLEYDLERGARGSRSSHLDRVLGLLFPRMAFHVVNNNAAAVLLALNTLAEGKEVIVSRGELVEIGGSFRIPDVMRKSGAVLREVGTTNKTRLPDYERAIGPKTGLILKVHPSNYRIVGFTAHASLKDVAALGRKKKVPVLLDQGSGNLIDLAAHGIHNEPSVYDALADGADVVCFSGDKLLGGPQAGLIVGRPDLVKPMKENSLTRALRVDKVTYASLEAVLLEYARGTAETALPSLRMLTTAAGEIETRARRLVESIARRAGNGLSIAIAPGQSLSGGGSAPGEGLPTSLLVLNVTGRSARSLGEALRRLATPVIARIESGKVLLDLRTVLPEQDEPLAEAILAVRDAALS